MNKKILIIGIFILIGISLVLAATENLWSGSNAGTVGCTVTNSANADGSGTSTWASAVDDDNRWARDGATWTFTMGNSGVGTGTINSVTLYLKHYISGHSDDNFNLDVYDGTGWTNVQAWTGGDIPTTDTTNNWDVSATLDTWTKIDAAQVRIIGNGKDGGDDAVTWYVDTVELRVDYTSDSTPPNISITTPTNNTNTTNTGINVNYTTGSDAQACWYSNDTMSVNTTLADCGTNITTVTWSQGQHTVIVWANDSVGNENSSSVTFTVDSIEPNITIQQPANGTTYTSSTLDLNFTIIDASDISWIGYSLNHTANISIPTNSQLNISADTVSTIGENNSNRNLSQSFTPSEAMDIQTVSIRLKMVNSGPTNPKIQIRTDSGGTPSSTVLAEGSIPTSGLGPVSFAWTNITLNETLSLTSDSTYWLYLTPEGDATDHFIWENNSNIYSGGMLNINGISPAGGEDFLFRVFDRYRYRISFTASEGDNNITISTNDSLGNMNVSLRTFFTIDTTYPGISITTPTNNTNTTNVNLNVNYTVTGQQTCWYSNDTMSANTTLASCANITSVTWTEGQHNVTVWVNDSAGNENSSSISFTIDTTYPQISITTPTNNSNSSDTGLDVNYTVSDANLESCWYSNDTMAVNTTLASCANITSVTWSEGQHNVTIWANDSSNNLGSSSVTFTIDITNPQVSITTPSNNTNTTNTGIDVNYTTSDSTAGVDSCWYSNDTMSANTTLASCANITSVTWSEGQHNVTIWANDSAGNTNQSSVTFTIDTRTEIDFVSPSMNSGEYSQTTIWANISVTETTGIDTINISLYNSTHNIINSTNSSTSSLFTNFTGLSEGNYYLNATVNDTLGNSNLTETRNITLDITNPVINLITPASNENFSTSTIELNFTITENFTIDTTKYLLDNTNTTLGLDDKFKIDEVTIGSNDEDDSTYDNLSQSFTPAEEMQVKEIAIYLKRNLAGNSNSKLQIRTESNGAPSSNILAEASINNNTVSTSYSWINLTLNQTVNLTADTVYWLFLTPKSTSPNIFFWQSSADSYSGGNYSNDNTKDLLFKAYDYFKYRTNITIGDGNHNITIYVNDSAGNEGNSSKNNFKVDTTPPAYSGVTATDPLNLTLAQNISITVTDALSNIDTVILEVDSTTNYTMNNDSANVYNYSWTPSSTGTVNYKIYMNDSLSNLNVTSSHSFYVNDTVGSPAIANITYTPNLTLDIDPNTSIQVNATVTDSNLDTVLLLYKIWNASSWSSTTMSNTSTLFNATFTPTSAETWSFMVQANDSGGLQTNSSITNISVALDWNWSITPTNLGTTAVIAGNTAIFGNLTINNTADYNLTFDLTAINAISGNPWTRISYNETEPFNLTNNSFKIIEISSTTDSNWPATDFNITIKVDSSNASASPSQSNTTAILRISTTTLAPTLEVIISEYDASPTQGDTNTSYKAYVKNTGTAAATNVSLNWTLPSGLSINTGSLSTNSSSLGVDEFLWNNITVDISSSATTGSTTIYANATSTEGANDSDTKTITIEAPETTTTTTTTGGGGGGGGGAIGAEAVVYSKIIEIVRGKEDSFDIEVFNKYTNSTLEDLTLDITGFLSHYITLSPSKISKIKPKQSKNFTVLLKIPSYKESYEEHTLKAVIKGYLVKPGETEKTSYTETQNILLIIQEVSKKASNLKLLEAEQAIKEMKEAEFNIDEVAELFEQAESKLSENKNKEAQGLSEKIINIKNKASETNSLIRRIAEALQNPKKSSLLTGNVIIGISKDNKEKPLKQLITGKSIFASESVVNMLNLAIAAFERGDYDVAEKRAIEAKNLLILERKGSLGLFFYLYWHFILLATIVLMTSGLAGYKQYRKSSITRKIEDINNGEENLRELITEAQKNYFTGKISVGEYHRIMDQHQKKLAKIRKIRLTLRNKRIKMLRPEQIFQELGVERLQVEAEIKKIQKEFYIDRKIPETEYKNQFQILNERLAEIEGERTTLELLKKKKPEKAKVKNTKQILERAVTKEEKEIKKESRRKEIQFKIKGKISSLFNRLKEKGLLIKGHGKERREKNIKIKKLSEIKTQTEPIEEITKPIKQKKSITDRAGIFKNRFNSEINKIKEKTRGFSVRELFRLPKKIIKKIKRSDKKAIVLIDNKVIDMLKEEASKIDCKGKYIRLNLKGKEDEN